MSLAKLLPRPIRLANYYLKAKKIVARKEMDDESKLEQIEKIEKNRGGETYFLADIKPSMVCLIGKKDIGKELIEIKAYEKAIRYLESAKKNLDVISEYSEESGRIIDNTVFILFYLANANAMLGKPHEAESLFEEVAVYISQIIDNDPANSRATELYNWFVVRETYNIMVDAQMQYPEMQTEYFDATKKLYQNYDNRDKGNEKIIKILELLS